MARAAPACSTKAEPALVAVRVSRPAAPLTKPAPLALFLSAAAGFFMCRFDGWLLLF
jgi:hypothetical protein